MYIELGDDPSHYNALLEYNENYSANAQSSLSSCAIINTEQPQLSELVGTEQIVRLSYNSDNQGCSVSTVYGY